MKVSLPPPPLSVSLPAFPISVSAKLVPLRTSFPAPPTIGSPPSRLMDVPSPYTRVSVWWAALWYCSESLIWSPAAPSLISTSQPEMLNVTLAEGSPDPNTSLSLPPSSLIVSWPSPWLKLCLPFALLLLALSLQVPPMQVSLPPPPLSVSLPAYPVTASAKPLPLHDALPISPTIGSPPSRLMDVPSPYTRVSVWWA